MKVLRYGILAWFRGISFLSLVTLANDVPSLEHIRVPPVCVGYKLLIAWRYQLSGSPNTITWTLSQPDLNRSVITLATYNGSFNLDPQASRYAGRISYIGANHANAGIQVANISRDDVGIYGVRVSAKELTDDLTDSVNVVLANAESNKITTLTKTFCSIESQKTSLLWNVATDEVGVDEICLTPTFIEWRKNGIVIATRDGFDGSLMTIPGAGNLNGRLFSYSTFSLLIKPTGVGDAGNYSLHAKYGDVSIESDEITVNVSVPINLTEIREKRACYGNDVVFPWNLTSGTDCNGVPRHVFQIIWKMQTSPQYGSRDVQLARLDDKKKFSRGLIRRNVNRASLEQGNVGLVLHSVDEHDTGTYDVQIVFQDGSNATNTTNLIVDTPQILHISSSKGLMVEKCEGESFVMNWTFIYPERNACDKPTIISRTWYYNGQFLLTFPKHQTKPVRPSTRRSPTIKKSTSQKVTPTKTTSTTTTPQSTIPEQTTSNLTTLEQTTPNLTSPEQTTPNLTSPEQTTPETTTISTSTAEIGSGSGKDMIFDTGNVESTVPKAESKTWENREEDDVLMATDELRSPPRMPRFVSQRSDMPHVSFDPSFDAGLAITEVKGDNSGAYYVVVNYLSSADIVLNVTSDHINLNVKKAPYVAVRESLIETQKLCSDDALDLKWNVERYNCSSPYLISWHVKRPNETEEKIGSSYGGRTSLTDNYKQRTKVTDRTNLKIDDLTPGDSGTYTIRLSYSNATDEDKIYYTFSESSVDVVVYNWSSADCTGRIFSAVKIQLTRNGQDVRLSTNRTVSIKDVVKASVKIPTDGDMTSAVFFWKETHHALLKQYFGRKCQEAGTCSIQWKVSKRCPGISFKYKEFRREVQLGVRINYMSKKFTTLLTSFYFRNHKNFSESTDSHSEDSSGSKSKSGTVMQCVLNRQIIEAIAMFWILLSLRRPF